MRGGKCADSRVDGKNTVLEEKPGIIKFVVSP